LHPAAPTSIYTLSLHDALPILVNGYAPAWMRGGLQTLQGLPSAARIFLAILLVDFIIYWIHRAQHQFDLLWRTHAWQEQVELVLDRKSTRLNSSHGSISYAVFC